MSALKIWERRKQLQFIEKKEKEFLRERVWAFWLWCGRFGHGVGVLVRFRKRGRQWERVKKDFNGIDIDEVVNIWEE